MTSIFDFLNTGDDDMEQEGGVDVPVTPVGAGAIDSASPSIPAAKQQVQASEDLRTVLDKIKNPKMSKWEELKTVPPSIWQTMKSGLGDDLVTIRVLDMFRDHEKQIRLGLNENIAQLPWKERKEFLTQYGEATDEEKVQGLMAEKEKLYSGAFFNELKKWKEALGPESPMQTTGLLREGHIAATGIARMWPVMVASMIPVAGKILAPAAAYMQIMGPKYEEYVGAGISKERSLAAANMAGVALGLVESGSELMQVGRILGRFKKAVPGVSEGFIKGLLKNAGIEGLEELTQAHLEVICDVWAGGEDPTGTEMAQKVFAIWKDPMFQKGAWK